MINDDKTIRQRFDDLRASFVDAACHEPTHCYIALDVARRAAKEHSGPTPMFQLWHPTMRFVVVATPPGVIKLTAED